MASLFDFALSNQSVDIVGVFDQSFGQVFQNARPLKAQVRPQKRIMRHTLEKGQTISDYAVVLPTEIILPVLIKSEFYRNTYEQISNLWATSELLSVHTRVGIFENMVIVDPPHVEDPDMFDAITMAIRFEEAKIVQSQTTFAPADPTQADMQQLGEQQPGTIAGVATSSGVQTIPLQEIPPGTNPFLPNQAPDQYQLSGVQTVQGQKEIVGPAATIIQSSFNGSRIF